MNRALTFDLQVQHSPFVEAEIKEEKKSSEFGHVFGFESFTSDFLGRSHLVDGEADGVHVLALFA